MDLNILIRGQSNAGYFSNYDAPRHVAAEVEALLRQAGRQDHVHLFGGLRVTEFGGTGMTQDNERGWLRGAPGPDWRPGPMEQTLLDFVANLPPATRSAPTLTLWMHNESDSVNPKLTTESWLSAVRSDAGWVRARLNQSPATTPYLFVWVPFANPPFNDGIDRNAQKIKAGMQALADDPGFDSFLGPQTGDMDMSGMGDRIGTMHMSAGDARSLIDRLARRIADIFLRLGRKGSITAADRQALAIQTPAVAAARFDAPAHNEVVLDVALDPSHKLQALGPAASLGAGWSVVNQAGNLVAATHVELKASGQLKITFAQKIPGGARLFYGYGHGRIAAGDGPGQGAAIYDTQGMPLSAPLLGMKIEDGRMPRPSRESHKVIQPSPATL